MCRPIRCTALVQWQIQGVCDRSDPPPLNLKTYAECA